MVRIKTIKVDLKDIDSVCRICGKVDKTVRHRSYRGKSFSGSCGDSFCWASCDMTSCKGVSTRACESCEKSKNE